MKRLAYYKHRLYNYSNGIEAYCNICGRPAFHLLVRYGKHDAHLCYACKDKYDRVKTDMLCFPDIYRFIQEDEE